MAVSKTKVSRDGGEDFTANEEDQLNLGPDVALVGDPADGQTIVDGTDDWDLPEGDKKAEQKKTKGSNGHDAEPPEFDEEDSRLAYTESGDPDDAPQGRDSRGRRSSRNARRRMAQQAAQRENEDLRRRVEELTGVVTRLATGQQGLAVNTLDGQMGTLQSQLRVVDDEMASAIKESDGDTYQKAQRLRDEIIGRLYTLKSNRDRMAGEGQDFGGGGQVDQQQQRQPQRQQQQAPDPRVATYFDRFLDRFDWFDPDNSDANSNIVRAVDAELVQDGYQRHTPVFWQRLERRLSDYGLRPNQASQQEDGGGDEQEDERPGRRPVTEQRRGPARPPTNGGRSTASGRSNGFRLTDIQTNILREEGLLEDKLSDEDKAKRQRIVDKWKQGAQTERRGASR